MAPSSGKNYLPSRYGSGFIPIAVIMAITLKFDGEFIVFHVSGLVTLHDLLAYAVELEALENSLPVSPHRLINLTAGTVAELAFPDMSAVAAKRRQTQLKNPVKSAMVAGDAALFGFARMFQTLNTHPNIQVEIFQTKETALAWLRE